jgi:predicted nucleic acid-binding protein
MLYVLDASITIVWAMEDEKHPVADIAFQALKSGSALVPGLWLYEVRNILVSNERRKRIENQDSERFIVRLRELPIRVEHHLDLELAT